MAFSDVYVIGDKLDLATEGEIERVEAVFGTRLPEGYREYVTILGAGQLNGSVRVLPPAEIADRTREFRETQAYLTTSAEEDGFSRWDLFDAGLDLLPPERLLSSILLIDAGDGFEIVFHPDTPDELFLLPHEDTEIFRAGSTLEEAIAWFLEAAPFGAKTRVLTPTGQFVERPVRYFEPDRDRERVQFNLKETVAFAEMRQHLVELALQQPTEALCVSEAYTNDDGTEGEVLHLFVKEYAGAVWCNDLPPEQGGITIQITYDRDRHTESLDHLIRFCRSRARFRIGANGIIRPM